MKRRRDTFWRDKAFKIAWLTQHGCCAHCGERERFIWRRGGVSGSFADGDIQTFVWRTSTFELDHKTPLHLGGSNDHENLQLLCIDCHKAKTASERSERARRIRELA